MGFDVPPAQVTLGFDPLLANINSQGVRFTAGLNAPIPGAPVSPFNVDSLRLTVILAPGVGRQNCNSGAVPSFGLQQRRGISPQTFAQYGTIGGGDCVVDVTTYDVDAGVFRGTFSATRFTVALTIPDDAGVTGIQLLNGSFDVKLF